MSAFPWQFPPTSIARRLWLYADLPVLRAPSEPLSRNGLLSTSLSLLLGSAVIFVGAFSSAAKNITRWNGSGVYYPLSPDGVAAYNGYAVERIVQAMHVVFVSGSLIRAGGQPANGFAFSTRKTAYGTT